MSHFRNRILPIVILLGTPFFCLAGSATYQTTPFTFAEPGWSYTGGTFTVSSFSTVDNSNFSTIITDWSVAFTSPTGSYTLTPSNSVFDYQDAIEAPNLEATATSLIFPSSPLATGGEFMSTLLNFAYEIRKPFGHPTQHKKRCREHRV